MHHNGFYHENFKLKVLNLEMHQIRWLADSVISFKLFMPIHLL